MLVLVFARGLTYPIPARARGAAGPGRTGDAAEPGPAQPGPDRAGGILGFAVSPAQPCLARARDRIHSSLLRYIYKNCYYFESLWQDAQGAPVFRQDAQGHWWNVYEPDAGTWAWVDVQEWGIRVFGEKPSQSSP